MTNLVERTLYRLGERLPGRVSRPGEVRYAAATAIWSKPVGRIPRAVVHCQTADDGFYRGYLPDDRSQVPLTVLLSTTLALWLLVYLVAAMAEPHQDAARVASVAFIRVNNAGAFLAKPFMDYAAQIFAV
jgi:hypothetical protein